MARDFAVRKYIIQQTEIYHDRRLTDVLIRAFNNIYDNHIPDGCLGTSVALHVILRSFGYDPKLCYGLCETPAGQKMYHAWLELDSKVIDLAIYGNSRYSLNWNDGPIDPVILENYSNTAVRYRDQVFDNTWDQCKISQIVRLGSIKEYIEKAPNAQHPSNNLMWQIIFAYLGETYSYAKRQELQKFVSKEALLCQEK